MNEENDWPQAAIIIGCSFAVAWIAKSVLTFMSAKRLVPVKVEAEKKS